MKTFFLFCVRVYRYGFSPLLPPCCRFYPGCGEYAEFALRQHRWPCAMKLIILRLLKCHPLHPGGYDPVP